MKNQIVSIELNLGAIDRTDMEPMWCSGELDVTVALTVSVINGIPDYSNATIEVTDVHVWLIDQDGGECGEADDYNETPAELAEWRLLAIAKAKQIGFIC